ncbi:MAG: flagellar biosynthesis anti-sigma factor FlgM [Eubacteriales bacterium]
MKINRGENPNAKIYNQAAVDNKTAGKNGIETNTPQGDKVVISKAAKEFSHMKKLVKTAADEIEKPTPPEKLMDLKKKVLSGSYDIPSSEIADALRGANKK